MFKKKILLIISLILLSTIILVFSLEIFLHLWNHSSIKKNKWNKSGRYSIYLNEKKKFHNIALSIYPYNFLNEKNIEIFPLSGFSNSLTINCNELGFYSRYDSDKFGFNNPNDEWDKTEYKYLLIGDSWVHGACVNFPDDIANQLRIINRNDILEKDKGILNLGYGGNGPLIENATLREYYPDKKVENILIFFAPGDDMDFLNEIKNPFLIKYLNNKNYSQDLKNNNLLLTKTLQDKFEKEIIKETENRFIRFDELSLKSVLTLSSIKHRVAWQFDVSIYHKREIALNKMNRDLLFKNYRQIKEFSESVGSNLYFVFLPGFPGEDDGYKILGLVKELNIPVINIKKEVFDKHPDKLSLFPFRSPGHYTPEGYKLIAKTIIEMTK